MDEVVDDDRPDRVQLKVALRAGESDAGVVGEHLDAHHDHCLDDAAIEELLVSALGEPVDAASVRQLVDEGGIWRLRGDLRPTARLVELVAQRLGDLPRPERDVLELLTLGEPLGQTTLAQLSDPDAVDAVEHKGLITSQVDGRRVQVWLAEALRDHPTL